MKLDQHAGTWKWGILCLLFLAPFFFLTYGFANQYAHNLKHVPSLYFEWEKLIPLWPWTIVPYWSIDLFYGLSLLLCWNTFELKQHAFKLFTAQLICIACFILFPLKFAFERPELTGFFGVWFDVLMGFDKPFNQAPSLHIVLLVILWDFYRRHVSGHWKYVVDIWSFLIGISVLTTWQHHFIDIPTGILVGGLCLWLFPVSVKSPFKKDELQSLTPKHIKLAGYYWIGALLCAVIAILFKGVWLWLLYPAISLCLVGFAYVLVRPHFFQKQADGRLTSASRILFAPYMLFAWINSRLWTKKHPEDSTIIQIADKTICLGRIPTAEEAKQYDALFDCCAELTVSHEQFYQYYLSLDLIPLQANQLYEAVKQFDQLWDSISMQIEPQRLLIFCALGYSRSTAILCAWLIEKEHASNVESAINLIKHARPWIVLNPEQIQQLNLFVLKLKGLSP
ncbi:phosphatase PAP2/dual specificity phosphatase family protein [Acinetobacter shaoyimingii]|uniref:Phosphatase PAP2/dual specificity phosphatase family protein n=1 Tax=Acinetobacter shaoyimingii TaxID=2715164 RepID=A0A6G8RVK3_9GAMM|nr:phosphatase PAP2/dual specificity phosphatase family protein [Acinetobacter shaoyimingii]QIO05753.1 phosphatase PAP2/dual specificity phosphatase family protein [Acinetobacter shaoyimingii]